MLCCQPRFFQSLPDVPDTEKQPAYDPVPDFFQISHGFKSLIRDDWCGYCCDWQGSGYPGRIAL